MTRKVAREDMRSRAPPVRGLRRSNEMGGKGSSDDRQEGALRRGVAWSSRAAVVTRAGGVHLPTPQAVRQRLGDLHPYQLAQ